MDIYSKQIEIRWADLDPNFHVLHSKYYDFGAYVRMAFLVENAITPQFMLQHHIGPILFREEAVFKREIRFGDKVTINLQATYSKPDFSRWGMQHEIFAGKDQKLSAIINVEGAWLDTQKRKLSTPPQLVIDVFNQLPKPPGFITLP